MAVKGVFTSDAAIQGDQQTDFAAGLLRTNPTGTAPMFALSAGMKSENITSIIHTWFEEAKLSGRVSVTNNAGSGTSLTVSAADARRMVVGQIYLVEASGEYLYVDAVVGTTITVSRQFGGSALSAIDGSSTAVPMQLVQQAHEEGSARPEAVANLGDPKFQYVGIFRNTWDVTGTAAAVSFHTGGKVAKNKADAAFFHGEEIELASIFGIRAIGTKNNRPFRTFDGVTRQIVTNKRAQSTNTKWSDIKDFAQDIFSVNIKGAPNERIAFCGNTVLGVMTRLAEINGAIQLQTGDTEFGLAINKLRTNFGTLTLMSHPLFNENPTWTKNLLVLHPAALNWLYLRRTKHKEYSDEDGRDAQYGVYTTECCCIYGAEKTGGYYTGIDTAAAES